VNAQSPSLPQITVKPATSECWPDIALLFGSNGAYAGCWCMFWRLERARFKQQKGAGNQQTLREMVDAGDVPGVLAYADGQAIGWCSIGPRETFIALESSRALKRVDRLPVWSIACFYVAKPFRQQGVMQALIGGAVQHAQAHGANIVEAYPLDLQTAKLEGQHLTSYAGYMGIASAFRAAGFVEAGRASETQLVMRYYL
jgi:GNAT superfamily N-acetyltransferase